MDFGVCAFFGRPDAALPDLVAVLEGLSLRDLVTAEEDTSSSALRLLLRVLPFPLAVIWVEEDALEVALVGSVAVFFVPDDSFVAWRPISMIGVSVRLM